MNDQNKVVLLMGPTAAGKTASAIELIKKFPFEIISVDSAMIYKDMDIGTAKPDSEILQLAPHRMISFLDPAESYSVASFCQQANQEIEEIHKQGKIPLLVGGTMMYFRALQNGLAELPEADPQIREEINNKAKESGWAVLHEHLQKLDPHSAAKIHPNDPQRIQRALEVFFISGVPLSELLKIAQAKAFNFDVLKLVIGPEYRRELDSGIKARFEQMLDQGFLDEVKSLQARGDLNLDMPSMRCVGYRQAWEHLLGNLTEEDMKQQAIHATEQLAKRQYTWLKSEPEVFWFDSNCNLIKNRTNVSKTSSRTKKMYDLVEKYVENDLI